MAKIITTDYTLRSGKMSKKDDTIYRTRNGKMHSYTQAKNTNPASKAQNAHRKLFGKTTTLVNKIIADPEQLAEWTQRMKDHNRSFPLDLTHKQYKTVHQYIFAVIKEQLEKQEAKKRKRNPIKKALPKGFKMIIKPFAELTTTELYEILKARFTVFYMEQHCYYQNMDTVLFDFNQFKKDTICMVDTLACQLQCKAHLQKTADVLCLGRITIHRIIKEK